MSKVAAEVRKEMSDRATRRKAVFDLLADGRWHRTTEFQRADVGGSEGMRRVREVRAEVEAGKHEEWEALVKRKAAGSSQYEYRLVRYVPQQMRFFGKEADGA